MIREYKCSFCGHSIPRTSGQMYVKIDGSILRFCNKKCKRSMTEMKRNPRKLKWTSRYERKY
ncbi:MAG: ribosomal protein L24e family protein [Candidatus Heimdallarchaeota archaeon]|nr:ribosomal protein L24e family protein [Candidatus Heimdallarchaeota archaeon]